MSTQTYTVAQALQTTASGITVVDTPINIADAIGNSDLLSRVSLFTLSGDAAVDAYRAEALYTLGSAFSLGGYSLTIRDTVGSLTFAGNAQAPLVGTSVQVVDTAADILAAANNPIIHGADTISVVTDSTLTLAQLQLLETWPHFTASGTIITLADTAANLLAVTPDIAKPALQVYEVAVDSTVSAADAVTLSALPGFTIASGTTLTISDSLASMNSFSLSHLALATMPGVALQVSDSIGNLVNGTATLTTLTGAFPAMSVVPAPGQTVTASQLADLQTVPNFSTTAGHTLTVADTMANLLALSAAQIALVQDSHLLSSETASVAQVQQLSTLPGFTAGSGNQLSVSDSIVHLAELTPAQTALLTNLTADDTVANLVAALATNAPAFSAITHVTAELDSGSYTVAQLTQLGQLANLGELTLAPTANGTSLHVVDTLQDIAAGASTLSLLQQAGDVTVTATNDHSILSASDAAALVAVPGMNPSDYTLAVSDTGPAISAVADSIFNHGFQSITVTSGTLAVPLADLLDPTLHFAPGGAAEAAQLSSSATVDTATLAELAALPAFGVAGAATLTVQDTAEALAAHEATVAQYAGAVRMTDLPNLTAAEATQLADLRSAVGATHFSLGGNFVLIANSAANLINPANNAGVTLAASITLADDARVSAAQATQLVALGPKFSPGSATLILSDTAANLTGLTSNPTNLVTLNTWHSLVLLSADATLSVADATLLAAFSGFTPGSHHLVISDTAQNLLQASPSLLTMAYAVQLSQPATLTVADATALSDLHTQFTGTNPVTVADTPLHLAAMPATLASFVASETLAAETAGNASQFVIDAAQLATLAALPNLDASAFASQITLADTATTLLATAPTLPNLPLGLIGHIVPELSADATVSASQAESLHALSGFVLNGHSLTISDTALHIAGLDAGTRAMATDIQVTSGGSALSAADYLSLTQLPNFSGIGQVAVADTASALQTLVPLTADQLTHLSSIAVTPGSTVTAAQAQALTTLPNLQANGNVSIADTAANLLQGTGAQPDDWAGEQLASHVSLSADATIDAAQAAQLAQLGSRFDNGGHTLTVQDTPTALLADAQNLAPIANQIGVTELAANATPWVVSLATAAQLGLLPHFTAGPAGAVVADTVANILAPSNATLVGQVPAVTLSGDDSATVAQAQALNALADFSLGTHGAGIANQLTITDSIGHLAQLDAATAAMASAIDLQGSGIASVAQFDAIRALPNYSDNGNLLLISDTATHLLALVGSDVSLASAIMLTPDPSDSSLSAMQAEQLASLPGFTPGIAQIGVLDTAAHLLQVTGAGPMPDYWNGELAASTVTLSQDATVSATQAAELALLGSRFSLGGHTLTVSDGAAALTSTANASGLAMATTIALSGDQTLSAADATRLAGLGGLDKAGHTVTVTDSAANLAFAGYAGGLALADTVQLGSATSLDVGAAEALIALPNFAPNAAAPLTIVDTLSNLLDLGAASLAHNNAVLQATPIALSADTVATVAQMAALAALPEYAQFSRNGHTLTVADTGQHLAGFMPDAVAVPTAYVMTGDATVTAAQADTLAAMAVDLNGNMLTVADTPAALLDAGNASGVALANSLALSGNATVDAATAQALSGLANFSTGGHLLTVSDTAQALLAMNAGTQQMASMMSLSGDDTVDVAGLLGLTLFGIKFSTAGHNLAVGDTAAHLATLNPLETALTTAQVLNTNATITGAVATQLADLPHFQVGSGVSLTVQDSVANLLALPASVQAIATAEQLAPGATVTVTAADAAGLAALPHFSAAGSTITVDDTIAALNNPADTGWHSVASGYVVTNSVANLVANASTVLLTGAAGVNLLGDTQVDAATLATLASIPHFESGTATLTVVDGPAAIAAQAANIAAFATTAQVDASTPVTAAQAELLAGLDTAGKLSFATGVHLTIQDSYANLTDAANADGVALAGSITVLDDVSQVLAATQHNWGSQNPFYDLNADGTVTGAQATTLNALGTHFSLNGHILSVADTAAGTAANAAALTGLGLSVTVTDTIANVDANAAALVALGNALVAVNLTDTTAVTAADAGGLHDLAAKLGGNPVEVADTATAVDTSLANLQALGTHLTSVQVTDSAANVAGVATDLSGLSAILGVTLTDTAPVDAAVAVGLLPVQANLAAGTMIDVADTGAALAASEAGLAQLGTEVGTITLTDGNTTNAAVAAALAPLDGHLGAAVQLQVQDSAAAIVAVETQLLGLQTDGRLAGVVATNETAADVVAHSADLATLHATAQIIDTVAAVSANLDALQGFLDAGGSLSTIALTDTGTPSVIVSLAQVTADAGVLAALPYPLSVQDQAAALQADLTSPAPVLVFDLANISSIVVTDSGTITLTAPQILQPTIDDGAGSVLSKMSGGSIAVTDAAVADLDRIATLGVVPTSVAVTTTSANLQADLSSGSSSLLAHLGLVTTITADTGTVTLTETQALATGVDDGVGSVFAKLNGSASLAVTHVLAADAATVAALPVAPVSIAIDDTAANIQADLTSGSSALLAERTLISGITVSDSGPITLTEAQATAAHMDDDATSILAKMPGAQLTVTGVSLAQLPAVDALYVAPAHMTISDTAANIQADLTSGSSALMTHLPVLQGIVGDGGVITLTEAQVMAPNVDDGPASVLGQFSNGTLQVTGVAVADVPAILNLGFAPSSITVSDTTAAIQNDLASGTDLVPNLSQITWIAATNGGTLSLTATQVLQLGVDDGPGSAIAKLTGANLQVTGATIGQLASLAMLNVPPGEITVSDSAANLQADLTSPTPQLLFTAGPVTSIALTDPMVPVLTLTVAELTRDSSVMMLITTPYQLAISDTAANLQAALQAGAPTMMMFGPQISTISVGGSGIITLTAAEALRPMIDDGPGSMMSKMTGETLVITDAHVIDIPMLMGMSVMPMSVTVNDTAAAISADLASVLPNLVMWSMSVTGITVSDGGTIQLTEAQIQAPGVDDSPTAVLSLVSGGTIQVTGVLAADINTIASLPIAPTSIVVSDTAAAIQADLVSGTSAITAHLGLISGITVNGGGTITLTEAQVTAPGVDDGASSVFAKMTGGSLAVTGVDVAHIDTVATLPVAPTSIAVTDTAALIQNDLASGTSAIVNHLSLIGGITVSDSGTISLTEAQVLAPSVDDGAGSVFAKLSGGTLTVTNVAAADVGTVGTLPFAPSHILVNDTAADIAADLGSASSRIVGNLALIELDHGERRRHGHADRGADRGGRRRCGPGQAVRHRGRQCRTREPDRHGARPRRAAQQHLGRGHCGEYRGGPGLRHVGDHRQPAGDHRDLGPVRQYQPDPGTGHRARRG